MGSREAVQNRAPADRVRLMAEQRLSDFPWQIPIRDWTGQEYAVGHGEPHWSSRSLDVVIKSPAAAGRLLAYDAMGFLEKHLEGEVDLEGNLYLMPELRRYARFGLSAMRAIPSLLLH